MKKAAIIEKKAAIIGAAGYAGKELIALLQRHSVVSPHRLYDLVDRPVPLAQEFPELAPTPLKIEPFHISRALEECEIVFLALPHGVAQQYALRLYRKGRVIIDLSADFRFRRLSLYQRTYKVTHQAQALNKQAVYGLPEFFTEQIRRAELIAVPGCYPTAIILAAAPLLIEGLAAEHHIIADAKSGVSGAGRTPAAATHFPECNESVKPYAVGEHRHQPEIEEQLSRLCRRPVSVLFTPHLVPMNRGILSTVYVSLQKRITEQRLRKVYQTHYQRARFVRVLDAHQLPETRWVVNSNYCLLGMKLIKNGSMAVILSAIDNLIKGAAGQAIQCMNLRLGFKEDDGVT